MSSLRARTGVTAITGEFTTSRAVVRKRTANASNASVERLILILNREQFTGTVTIGMSDGHVRTIKAEDSADIVDWPDV